MQFLFVFAWAVLAFAWPNRSDLDSQLQPAANSISPRGDRFASSDVGPTWIRDQESWDSPRARTVLNPTLVTLQGKMNLAAAFQSLGRQAGVKFVGTDVLIDEIDVEIHQLEFWRALDQVISGRPLLVEVYGLNAGEIRIVQLDRAEKHATPIVCYDGPYRIAAVRCESAKDYSLPSVDQLRVVLGIHWEPRIRPIAFQVQMRDVVARGDAEDDIIGPRNAGEVVESNVPTEVSYAEIALPFELAPRSNKELSRISGTLYAILPDAPEKFQFENLDELSTGTEIRKGGLVVRLEGWSAEDSGFGLRLRIRFDQDHGALDSFRTWIQQNRIELHDGMGTAFKPIGLEVSTRVAGEVTLKYLFQKDPTALNLDYWSATNILRVPILLDLQHLILP